MMMIKMYNCQQELINEVFFMLHILITIQILNSIFENNTHLKYICIIVNAKYRTIYIYYFLKYLLYCLFLFTNTHIRENMNE